MPIDLYAKLHLYILYNIVYVYGSHSYNYMHRNIINIIITIYRRIKKREIKVENEPRNSVARLQYLTAAAKILRLKKKKYTWKEWAEIEG